MDFMELLAIYFYTCLYVAVDPTFLFETWNNGIPIFSIFLAPVVVAAIIGLIVALIRRKEKRALIKYTIKGAVIGLVFDLSSVVLFGFWQVQVVLSDRCHPDPF